MLLTCMQVSEPEPLSQIPFVCLRFPYIICSFMVSDEMNKNRKLFAPYQRCRRGRITVELNQTAVVFNQTHEGKP